MIVPVADKRDPDAVIREAWAESLQENLDAYYDAATGQQGMSRKQLQAGLAALGVDVTLQAIGMWLSGQTAPRPSAQIAIARVLGAPARRVFPLETAA